MVTNDRCIRATITRDCKIVHSESGLMIQT